MSEETKWTKGPWSVFVQPVTDRDGAKAELAQLIDGTPDFQSHVIMISAPNGLAPAVTGCGVCSEANAHLIAAAPDLYEALEKMVSLDASEAHFEDAYERILPLARAALAKASGA